MDEKTFQIEEAFGELENIIEQLESEDVSLRDSIGQYSKGANIIAKCKDELSGIEKEIIIIGEELQKDNA